MKCNFSQGSSHSPHADPGLGQRRLRRESRLDQSSVPGPWQISSGPENSLTSFLVLRTMNEQRGRAGLQQALSTTIYEHINPLGSSPRQPRRRLKISNHNDGWRPVRSPFITFTSGLLVLTGNKLAVGSSSSSTEALVPYSDRTPGAIPEEGSSTELRSLISRRSSKGCSRSDCVRRLWNWLDFRRIISTLLGVTVTAGSALPLFGDSRVCSGTS